MPDVWWIGPDHHYEPNNKYNVCPDITKLYLHSPIKIPVSSSVFLLIFFLKSFTMVCLGFTLK